MQMKSACGMQRIQKMAEMAEMAKMPRTWKI